MIMASAVGTGLPTVTVSVRILLNGSARNSISDHHIAVIMKWIIVNNVSPEFPQVPIIRLMSRLLGQTFTSGSLPIQYILSSPLQRKRLRSIWAYNVQVEWKSVKLRHILRALDA